MKVSEVMCRPVSSCTEEMSLSAAARRMGEDDCGALPVVRQGRVVGMITDRDVCLAVGDRRRLPKETPVRDIMTRDVALCHTDDDIHDAIAVMASRQVRRLPVLDVAGTLEGILSVDDVVLRAEEMDPSRTPALSCRDVLSTLRAIYGSRRVRLAASSSGV
ncbi:MAG TPA: CBS domain-containing protein [Thermoanaerobaculia bacterium]|jgi:CBS domain-containing protein